MASHARSDDEPIEVGHVGDWTSMLDAMYPPADAADWDNVGLQVGAADWPVARALVTLDVTSKVVDEAAEVPATLVVAHHPLLFRPLARLTPATAAGRIALTAARAGVAITAVHTNLDVATDGAGTSRPIADALELIERRPLTTETRQGGRAKLVTFVPPEAVDTVIDALASAGAGRIGDYERCTFRVLGTGTFRPLEGADPYSGAVGEDSAEQEYRLEVELPTARIGAVVAALLSAHPYDEVAYDLVPLIDGATSGFGIVGRLPTPQTLAEVAATLRTGLPAPHLRYAGAGERVVSRVACVGGAGDGLVGAALAADVDVYVTGDLRHHVALDALEQGLALVDAGHHATEVAAMPHWIERIANEARTRSLTAPVVASREPTVPWS